LSSSFWPELSGNVVFSLDNLSLFRYFIGGISENFLGCLMAFTRAVPKKYRFLIPEYVKDYVSLNQFAA
jgi:hypothetical protein